MASNMPGVKMQEGVPQGNPLSTIAFCLAIQKHVEITEEGIRKKQNEIDPSTTKEDWG
ncbi:hypothetical protein ScalyP_jg6326, partial [Parmales sp. scaly parma]